MLRQKDAENKGKMETRVSVYLTTDELKDFDKAVKKSGRFVSRSDAIRYLIRKFIDDQGVTPRQVVEHPYGGEKKVEVE
ncbi:hypothetical protein Asulf_01488 [Archaeoglobus sulfaticallidus PM70-1]|uniref:Ribbon-helix-helix protein CopG domain-containing protein n=1 Tax=Archaeoglobus sulfaticallidus PM70-1 TaxID=387631 RepID=N0BLQ7_9EURY|nr:ribbon-helix-helix domain-containing protein [Archaeoglobus sulfaticallidus]AGK61471.1 hypothetical protein Asulf_01488 [Archaeoglobus sulfaticallidus PM70-1]